MTNKKTSESKKVIWLILLLMAIILFILGLTTSNLFFNLIAIVLATAFYKYGDNIVFKELNTKRLLKKEQSDIVKHATKEVIVSGKLFKKTKWSDRDEHR